MGDQNSGNRRDEGGRSRRAFPPWLFPFGINLIKSKRADGQLFGEDDFQ